MAVVAVVDDDADIRSLLGTYLRRHGFDVWSFEDGESFLDTCCDEVDVVVLDIGLPGIDGLAVCAHVRADSNLPIIMLTAASDDIDRILGLELGADDYLGKPFNPRELLARIRALLRRIEHAAETPPPTKALSKLEIDHDRQEVRFADVAVPLTGAEFELFRTLFERHGEVISRDELARAMRGRPTGPFDRSLDTAVRRLRNKLSDATDKNLVKSVRGRGYKLVLP